MSYSGALALVKAVVVSVPGTGKVHDYLRLATTHKDFLDLFTTDKAVNGWQITRNSVKNQALDERQQLQVAPGKRGYGQVHSFLLMGIRAIEDSAASEKTFQNTVDALIDTILADESISTAGYECSIPQVPIIEPRAFGPVLCHVAEVQIDIYEQKEIEP